MRKESRHLMINEIVNSVRVLQSVSRRQSSEFIRKHRITGPQLGALRFVSLTPGISMRRLSDSLYLHVSTVSGIVDRLVKRGYIVRKRSDMDRRIIHLEITAAGRRVIKTTPLAGMGLLIHTIDSFPERQLRDVRKGLRIIFDIMKIKDEKFNLS